MKIRKSPFILGASALLISITIGFLPSAPAAAEIAAEEVKYSTTAQTLTVEPTVAAPDATRDAYSVTVYTVVQWPTADRDVTADGDFGSRSCRGCSANHQGVDFNPGGGTPVSVVADGTVLVAGWDGALGQAVVVAHTIDGVYTETTYGHMIAGSLQVVKGQTVKRGQTLGLVGNTGMSTGNHLHFAVSYGGGSYIDPMPWLWQHVNLQDWE